MALSALHKNDHSRPAKPRSVDGCADRVAFVYPSDTSFPRVFFHSPDIASEHPRTPPGLDGHRYVTQHLDSQDEEASCINKALAKNKSSLDAFCRYGRHESHRHSRSGETRHSNTSEYSALLNAKIGPAAFVSQSAACKNVSPLTSVFTKVHLTYGNGVVSKQHIHVRNVKQINTSEELRTARLRPVVINTGMCLFSQALISSVLTPRPDPSEACRVPWAQTQALTLYETEILIRLSSTIADVVGLLQDRSETGASSITVNVDLPDVQYYLRAFELLDCGMITRTCAQDWIVAVDERRRKLWILINFTITNMLKDRSLTCVQITLAQGTEAVRRCLKGFANTGSVPSLDELLDELLGTIASTGEDAHRWQDFLKLQKKPKDIHDLGCLMHVFNSVRPALHGAKAEGEVGAPSAKEGSQLLLQVDDIVEWRIFDRAKRFLRSYQADVSPEHRVRIVGLFPLQKVFTDGNEWRCLWTAPLETNTLFYEDDCIRTTEDVLQATYGLYVPLVLRTWDEVTSAKTTS